MDRNFNNIEGVPTAKRATHEQLRLCRSESDAIAASILISTLSQDEIAKRMGVSKQSISKYKKQGVPGRRVRAFCNATGTTLLAQFYSMQRAMREATGTASERDYIARIAEAA